MPRKDKESWELFEYGNTPVIFVLKRHYNNEKVMHHHPMVDV
jgi:hypothetical protein